MLQSFIQLVRKWRAAATELQSMKPMAAALRRVETTERELRASIGADLESGQIFTVDGERYVYERGERDGGIDWKAAWDDAMERLPVGTRRQLEELPERHRKTHPLHKIVVAG